MARHHDEAALRCGRIALAWAAWEAQQTKVLKHFATCTLRRGGCSRVDDAETEEVRFEFCPMAPARPELVDWAAVAKG